jgi:hypothetical protein
MSQSWRGLARYPLRWDVVLRLTFSPPLPSPPHPSPPRPLVVWCFFSRLKTTFVIFLTFLGYLGLSWASLGYQADRHVLKRARARARVS